MPKRSERLSVVLELTVRKEKSALDALAKAQNALRMEQERYTQLEIYMRDYQEKIRGDGAQLHVSLYANYQNFMQQLGVALAQQEKKLQVMKQQVGVCTQAWRLAHEKTKGMQDHIHQCRQQEQREQSKSEQKMLDEFSQLSHRYRDH